MKLIDISMPIETGMKVYKNKPEKQPAFKTVSNHEKSSVHETDLSLNLHTGTHVDAPLHMIKNGATTDAYPLDKFYGKALLIDLRSVKGGIEKSHLLDYDIEEGDIVLLKTRNSYDKVFNFEFTYLAESGAQYLLEKRIKTVGIDALGIERAQENYPTHKILLSNSIPIIEGLVLKDVEEGIYQFMGFPIAIKNVEGSLLRAVLCEV